MEPAGMLPEEGGGEGRGDGRRRAPKDLGKKKKGARGADRGRTRRDSEGLRAPRARDRYEDDDE
jgi:hypothetical protein